MSRTPVRLMATASVAVLLALTACGSSDKTLSTADFCTQIKKANTDLGSGIENSKTIGALKTNVGKVQAKLVDFTKTAPSDIKKDVKTISDEFKKIVTTANESTSLADFGKRAQKLEPQLKDYTAAGNRLNAWQTKNCKATKK